MQLALRLRSFGLRTRFRGRVRPRSVGEVPWEFGFQCNERYLKWDRSAQSQLVKLVAMEKLKLTPAQFRSRLVQLTVVLPDLSDRLDTMKATLLVELMRDPNDTAEKIVVVKTALPNLDVGGVIRRYPELIANHSMAELKFHIERLIQAFHGDVFRVEELLTKEPRCLKIDLEERVREVKRLMPECQDPLGTFLNDPGQFLSMEQMGLEATN